MNTKTDRPPLQCEAVARAALGNPLRQERQELLRQCPNHEQQHPSLKVNRGKKAWLCGSCGASGNAWELAVLLAFLQASDKPAITAWLRERGLLPREGNPSLKAVNGESHAEELREHTYVSEHGEPLAKEIRWGT
jgi:hypothetical protein